MAKSLGPRPATDTSAASLTSGAVLARNTAWNVFGQGVPLLAALVAIPFVLRGLGTDRFGALSLAWLLIGYFSLFDLGLGRALTKLVSERLAEGREDEVPDLAWTGFALMVGFGVVGGIVIAVSSAWVVSRVLQVPPALQEETRDALRVLAVSVPFVIGTAGLRGLLEATQRFGLVNALRIPMGVLTFVGPALVLPFSRSLVAVVGVLALGRVVGCGIHLWACLRILPALRGGRVARPSLAFGLLRLGGWMTVSNVVGPVIAYADRFLIGGLLGLAAVAYYATPFEVVTKLLLVPSAIAQVLFPAFSASLVAQPSRTGVLSDRGLKVIFLALFPPALVLVILGPELLDLWLGAEFARESARVLQLLTVGVFINALAQIPFGLIQAAGRPDLTARLHLVELPAYLLVAWGLIRAFGVKGAAVAWIVRAAVDAAVLFAVAERLAPSPRKPAWLAMAFPAALVAFGVGGLSVSLFAKGVLVIAGFAAFAAAAWLLVLTGDERSLARDYAAQALRVVGK